MLLFAPLSPRYLTSERSQTGWPQAFCNITAHDSSVHPNPIVFHRPCPSVHKNPYDGHFLSLFDVRAVYGECSCRKRIEDYWIDLCEPYRPLLLGSLPVGISPMTIFFINKFFLTLVSRERSPLTRPKIRTTRRVPRDGTPPVHFLRRSPRSELLSLGCVVVDDRPILSCCPAAGFSDRTVPFRPLPLCPMLPSCPSLLLHRPTSDHHHHDCH